VIEVDLDGVRAWFTDRRGGVSAPPYAEANLADHVGDEIEAVARNRRDLAARLGLPPPHRWQWLRQVHGATVTTLDAATDDPPEADAAVSATGGVPLVVLTADCAPIVLAAEGGIGVVHAGWPGLEQGTIERAAAALGALTSTPIRAVLGPCIRPARYEFGDDLLARLVARLGPEVASRTHRGAPALDIPTAVHVSCAAAGITRFDDVGVCTAGSEFHFSYRRDGVTGRQAAVVVR